MTDVIITKFFPLCVKNGGMFWEALNRYEKQEEER